MSATPLQPTLLCVDPTGLCVLKVMHEMRNECVRAAALALDAAKPHGAQPARDTQALLKICATLCKTGPTTGADVLNTPGSSPPTRRGRHTRAEFIEAAKSKLEDKLKAELPPPPEAPLEMGITTSDGESKSPPDLPAAPEEVTADNLAAHHRALEKWTAEYKAWVAHAAEDDLRSKMATVTLKHRQRRLLEVPKRTTAAIHRLFYLTHSHIPTMEVASVLSPATRDATDGIGAFYEMIHRYYPSDTVAVARAAQQRINGLGPRSGDQLTTFLGRAHDCALAAEGLGKDAAAVLDHITAVIRPHLPDKFSVSGADGTTRYEGMGFKEAWAAAASATSFSDWQALFVLKAGEEVGLIDRFAAEHATTPSAFPATVAGDAAASTEAPDKPRSEVGCRNWADGFGCAKTPCPYTHYGEKGAGQHSKDGKGNNRNAKRNSGATSRSSGHSGPCWHCGQPGHRRANCPILANRPEVERHAMILARSLERKQMRDAQTAQANALIATMMGQAGPVQALSGYHQYPMGQYPYQYQQQYQQQYPYHQLQQHQLQQPGHQPPQLALQQVPPGVPRGAAAPANAEDTQRLRQHLQSLLDQLE